MSATKKEVDALKAKIALKEKELLKRYPAAYYNEIHERSEELKTLRAELKRREASAIRAGAM